MPDKVIPIGIGLKKSTWGKIEKIAEDLGVSRHAVTVYLIRYALNKYESGELEIKASQRPVLDAPD